MDAPKSTTKTVKPIDSTKKIKMNNTGKFKNLSAKASNLSIGGCIRRWSSQIEEGTFTYKDSTTQAIIKPGDVVNGVVLDKVENFYAVLKTNPNYIPDGAVVYNFNNMIVGPATEVINWIAKSREGIDVAAEFFGDTPNGQYYSIDLVAYMDAKNGVNVNVPYYVPSATEPNYSYQYMNLKSYLLKVKDDSKAENEIKKKTTNENTKKRTGGVQKFIFTKATEIKDAPVDSIDIISPSLIKVLVESIDKKTEVSKEKRKGRNIDIGQRINEVMQTSDKILNITGIKEDGTGIKKVNRPQSLSSNSSDKKRTSDLVPVTAVNKNGIYYIYYKGNQAGISKAIEIFGRLSGYDVSADLEKINRPTAAVTIQAPRIQ